MTASRPVFLLASYGHACWSASFRAPKSSSHTGRNSRTGGITGTAIWHQPICTQIRWLMWWIHECFYFLRQRLLCDDQRGRLTKWSVKDDTQKECGREEDICNALMICSILAGLRHCTSPWQPDLRAMSVASKSFYASTIHIQGSLGVLHRPRWSAKLMAFSINLRVSSIQKTLSDLLIAHFQVGHVSLQLLVHFE